jgi:hypothetical protein
MPCLYFVGGSSTGFRNDCFTKILFSILEDKMKIGDCSVPAGYVIQCIVNPLQFDVIET